MNDPKFGATESEIAAAEAYDGLHVPSLFGPWAPRVAAAAKIGSGDRVLDVACGTGVLAIEAAGRAGEGGFVAGLDPNPGMLTVAQRRAPEVEWRAGTADAVPYEDGAFDAVVSQFGLMFFPDRASALGEMRRVLAPGGRIVVAVWGPLEDAGAYPIVTDLLQTHAGDAAAEALRAPFVLGDTGALREPFARAGIHDVEIDTQRGTARFPDIRTMVEAELRGWLPVMGVALDESCIRELLRASERALARYVRDGGPVEFDVSAHLARATLR